MRVMFLGWVVAGCSESIHEEGPPSTACDRAEVPYDGVDNDCDPNTPDDDLDGDGRLEAEDCDDDDPARGGVEVALDGVDNDCDGVQGVFEDADGDGWARTDDCEDDDPLVGPETALGVAGVWEGTLEDADLDGYCDGYCRRPLQGDLRLTHSARTDLDGLWCLARITGDLVLGSGEADEPGESPGANPYLASVAGLAALEEVQGDVEISGNQALASLAGLSALTSIGGDLTIEYVPSLTSIEALSGLERVGGSVRISARALGSLAGLGALIEVGQDLDLTGLAVVDLHGLDALAAVGGSLVVAQNPALERLDGLEDVRSVGWDLRVNENPALVDVMALRELCAVGHGVVIENNPSLTDEAAEELLEEIPSMGVPPVLSGNG